MSLPSTLFMPTSPAVAHYANVGALSASMNHFFIKYHISSTIVHSAAQLTSILEDVSVKQIVLTCTISCCFSLQLFLSSQLGNSRWKVGATCVTFLLFQAIQGIFFVFLWNIYILCTEYPSTIARRGGSRASALEPEAEDPHRCSSRPCFPSFIRKANHLQGLQGFKHLTRFGKYC